MCHLIVSVFSNGELPLFTVEISFAALEDTPPPQLVVAGGNKYHQACFKCHQCSKVFTDGRYMEVNGKPTCQDCGTSANERAAGAPGADAAAAINAATAALNASKASPAPAAAAAAAPVSKMKFCGECGATLGKPGAKFCNDCGASQA